MRRMQVLIDGETTFEGDVEDWVLPSRPELFPAALLPQVDRQAPPSPLAKLTILTALIAGVVRALESPMLAPLDVDLRPRGMGCFTLTVDFPDPMANREPGGI